jgi:hypothetical protein
MRRHVRHLVLVTIALLAAAGCGSDGSDSGGGGDGGGGDAAITITSPKDGDTVQVPFTITYETEAELGKPETGKDHVHVFTDGNENDYTVVGGNSFEITDLSPGEHTINVTLQHADHSPVGPAAEITVTVGGSAPGGGGGSETSPPPDYDY